MIQPRITRQRWQWAGACRVLQSFGAVIIGIMPCALISADGEPGSLAEVLRESLPKYDSPRPKDPPKRERDPMHAPRRFRPLRTKADANGNVSQEKPVVLPRFMVRPADDLAAYRSAPTLPRMVVRPPVRDEPPVQFETPAARDERLVRKHLSEFDRFFLNRFTPFGVSKEQRARATEAVEHSAQQMDEIAEYLEYGSSSAADEKKAREAFLDTYVARPK